MKLPSGYEHNKYNVIGLFNESSELSYHFLGSFATHVAHDAPFTFPVSGNNFVVLYVNTVPETEE